MDVSLAIFAMCMLLLLVWGWVSVGHRKEEVPESMAEFDMYVINLDRMPTRMTSFIDRLQHTDMRVMAPIRIAAVDGKKLNLAELVTPEALREIERAERVGYRERHYELTRGAVGCALSHRNAWAKLLQSDKNIALVCEDDAELEPNALTELTASLAVVPPDWDLLLLGYWCVKCTSHVTHKKLERFFGLHCYLIKRGAVNKIISYAGEAVAQQEDSMLSDMCTEGRLCVYGVQNKLARQTGQTSSVQMPLRTGENVVDPWATLPVVMALRGIKQA